MAFSPPIHLAALGIATALLWLGYDIHTTLTRMTDADRQTTAPLVTVLLAFLITFASILLPSLDAITTAEHTALRVADAAFVAAVEILILGFGTLTVPVLWAGLKNTVTEIQQYRTHG